jgi:ComF family protein
LALLDLIFPPRCGGCGRYGASWCADCARTIERVVPVTLAGVPLIAAGRLNGPLQRAIHRYKYDGRRHLAAELATPLAEAITTAGLAIAALTFVPLHPRRQRERGFNQAERLATELAGRLQRPVVRGLSRVRTTPAQVGLSQPERRVNLIGAFAWTAQRPAPQGLALVDDVCTTGATLEAAAAAIVEAGGSVGAFLVAAQALPAPAVTLPDSFACP